MSLTLINVYNTMLAAMNKVDDDPNGQRDVNRAIAEVPTLQYMVGEGPILGSIAETINEMGEIRRKHGARFDPRALSMVAAERYTLTSIRKSIQTQRLDLLDAMKKEGLTDQPTLKKINRLLMGFENQVAVFDSMTSNKYAAVVQSITFRMGPHIKARRSCSEAFRRFIRQPEDHFHPGSAFTVRKSGAFHHSSKPARLNMEKNSSRQRDLAAYVIVKGGGTLDWLIRPDQSQTIQGMAMARRQASAEFEGTAASNVGMHSS